MQNTRLERLAMEISMLLQRVIVDGAMVDLEALTVQRGRLAWTLFLDIHVLCHSGNLIDCAVLAAMSALTSFRLPQTEVSPTGDLTIFPANEREPLPLTIHHIPFAVSFALFADGDTVVMDPTREEPEAAQGMMTVLMSEHGELCGLHKVEGCPVSLDVSMRCVRLATQAATGLGATLLEALKVHEIARVYSRVRRVGGGAGGPAMGSTAKAAEQVHAARLRVLAPATGEATLPRTEVTIAQAVPANQLPNLGALAVEGSFGKGAAGASQQGHPASRSGGASAQNEKQTGSRHGKAMGVGKIQIIDEEMQVPARSAPNAELRDGGGAGSGRLGASGQAQEDSDAMDRDVHPGIAVRTSDGKAQGEAGSSASRKKSKGSGNKRASPGGTSKGTGSDGFEEIAQLISGAQSDGAEAPKLASCVKTRRKKRKE